MFRRAAKAHPVDPVEAYGSKLREAGYDYVTAYQAVLGDVHAPAKRHGFGAAVLSALEYQGRLNDINHQRHVEWRLQAGRAAMADVYVAPFKEYTLLSWQDVQTHRSICLADTEIEALQGAARNLFEVPVRSVTMPRPASSFVITIAHPR